MSEIIYGRHTINSVLNDAPERLLKIYCIKKNVVNPRLQILVNKLQKMGIVSQNVSKHWFKKTVGTVTHQGIMAIVKQNIPVKEKDLPTLLIRYKFPLLLILDKITDPHNLGACLRCAEAAGVHAVIMQRDQSVKLNATVKKISSGAADIIPLIYVTNLIRTLLFLKTQNIWIVGTDPKAKKKFYEAKLIGSLALVMGSEDKGIRRLTRKHCDELISIPMVGSISSLNVSVSAGICLFEIIRQRLQVTQ